jgi:4-diphosphocytidyl-2-C-methyl-D-erythritol kinase
LVVAHWQHSTFAFRVLAWNEGRRAVAPVSTEETVSSLSWPAPAKINLFLHVTGRRPDGFHTLQTAFQFLDLCDRLDFECRQDGVIARAGDLPGVPVEQDLVVRAACALRAYAGNSLLGATIKVDKRLPIGGGLGGGSSDAATTLVALNYLWDLKLQAQELDAIGLKLGADVPIFLFGCAAFAEGVGELLTAIEPPEPWYVLLKPDCAVPTREVFQHPDLTRNTPAITIRAFLEGDGHNDCEPLVRRLFPQVDGALHWLGERAPARLTGTGACVFAPCASEAEAREICAQVPSRWHAYVVRGLNASPLRDRLGRARQGVAVTAPLAAGESAT